MPGRLAALGCTSPVLRLAKVSKMEGESSEETLNRSHFVSEDTITYKFRFYNQVNATKKKVNAVKT